MKVEYNTGNIEKYKSNNPLKIMDVSLGLLHNLMTISVKNEKVLEEENADGQ